MISRFSSCVKITDLLFAGGETIKEINRMTGCYVELSRDRPPNPHDRVFLLSGAPDQIQRAIGMICEKAGLVSFD